MQESDVRVYTNIQTDGYFIEVRTETLQTSVDLWVQGDWFLQEVFKLLQEEWKINGLNQLLYLSVDQGGLKLLNTTDTLTQQGVLANSILIITTKKFEDLTTLFPPEPPFPSLQEDSDEYDTGDLNEILGVIDKIADKLTTTQLTERTIYLGMQVLGDEYKYHLNASRGILYSTDGYKYLCEEITHLLNLTPFTTKLFMYIQGKGMDLCETESPASVDLQEGDTLVVEVLPLASRTETSYQGKATWLHPSGHRGRPYTLMSKTSYIKNKQIGVTIKWDAAGRVISMASMD